MTTEMITPENELLESVRATIDGHKNLVVKDDAGYIAAQEALKAIKARAKQVLDYFGPLVKKAHEMHKALKAKENAFTTPLDEMYVSISRECGRYKSEQEAIERKRAAEEEAKRRKEEEDRRLVEAQALQDAGRKEEAEAVVSAPVVVAPAPVRQVPKVQDVSYRDNWRFIIENAELVPREYLIPDETKIGQYVRAMKDAAKIPGVKIYCEKTPIIR